MSRLSPAPSCRHLREQRSSPLPFTRGAPALSAEHTHHRRQNKAHSAHAAANNRRGVFRRVQADIRRFPVFSLVVSFLSLPPSLPQSSLSSLPNVTFELSSMTHLTHHLYLIFSGTQMAPISDLNGLSRSLFRSGRASRGPFIPSPNLTRRTESKEVFLSLSSLSFTIYLVPAPIAEFPQNANR